VAAANPAKLKQMQALFWVEAAKYNVLPLDASMATRVVMPKPSQMRFTAVIGYESPSRLGLPLLYTATSEVILQRPDRLRMITPGDGPASEFYYDGKTIMAFEPAANLVAVADAPPTIDAALQAAYDNAAIYFPFTDVIVADPYKGVADGLQYAFYIGQSRVISGATTDMVAIVNNCLFEQIWIGADDKLPRKVRAVFLADPARLRHAMELSNWRLDSTVPADALHRRVPPARRALRAPARTCSSRRASSRLLAGHTGAFQGAWLPAALRICGWQSKDTKGNEQCARTDDVYCWCSSPACSVASDSGSSWYGSSLPI
jgi:hypothetical protein